MMVEWVTIGDARLACGDMREIMPIIRTDACVTDPPYGLGEDSRDKHLSRGKLTTPTDYGDGDWDATPADAEQIALIRACSDWQIVFGGNYFALPPAQCWLVWDKLNGNNDFADCELAWTNLNKAVRRIQYLWNGMIRRGEKEPRVHPTQKPIDVMAWCLSHLPASVETVCDPFMGSGTTGVACIRRGLKFIGIERDARYFDVACRRIEQARLQPDFFVSRAAAEYPQEPLL